MGFFPERYLYQSVVKFRVALPLHIDLIFYSTNSSRMRFTFPIFIVVTLLACFPFANPSIAEDTSSLELDTWSSTSTYSAGKFLLHGGETYFAMQNVPAGVTPGTNSEYWMTLYDIASTFSSPGTPPTDESFQSSVPSTSPGSPGGISRDFNNDGNDDVVLFDSSTNEMYVANLDGNTSWTGTGDNDKISIFAADGDGALWYAPAAADFNTDGFIDVVLQNKTSGRVNVAQMSSAGTWDGTKWSFYTSDLFDANGVGWRARATGDFNGDTKPDIVFQHDTTGDVFVCYVTATEEWVLPTESAVSGRYLLSEAVQGFKINPWMVRASGDFNGDGQMDLVFQNDDTSDVYTTYLAPSGEWTYGVGRYIYSTKHQGASAGAWQTKASGDFNGDGFPDLAFQNGNSKDIFIIYLTDYTSEWNQPIMGGRYLITSGTSANYTVLGAN